MTAVWTATSLRRQDSRYNSLSRSLGSLMSVVLDENKSPSVLIFSNQSSRIPSDDNLRASVSVGDRVGDENIPIREPSFRSLQTDSSSSIAYIGKKIKREYQSAFVLPDKQTVGIVRQEAFMTEEGLAQVTLSLCIANNSDNLKVAKSERICDYLETDYWASILLASTESHDAELLGYMGPEYTSRRPNRFNFERSESRRRKREIVLVQEEIDENDKEESKNFPGINILPESVKVYEELDIRDSGEHISDTKPLSPHPPPPTPPPKSPSSSSPRTSNLPEKRSSPKPQRIPSKISSQSREQAPIIGRAEPPGKNKAIISNPQSKENFEELKRQWNSRIAQMQKRLDDQYRDSPAAPSQTYTEGHRGSVITSILPTIDKRSDSMTKTLITSSDQRTPSEHSYEQQSLPDKTSAYYRANKENLISNNFDPVSPTSGLTGPVTERCEKEAQFAYSQARLCINQQNIGRLSPRLSSEFHSTSDLTKFKTRSLEYSRTEEQFTNSISNNIDLDNYHTSMSLLVSKDRQKQYSKQTYIYQSTLSRLPVTIKNLSSRTCSSCSSRSSASIDETVEKLSRYAKHELFVCREPTYYVNILTKSQTFPKHLSRAELKLNHSSPTSTGYENKFEMTIRVNDLHNTLEREKLHHDYSQRWSTRHRMYTSLPRTKHALMYYPQPGSPGIMLDSPGPDKSQHSHRSTSVKYDTDNDPKHYRRSRYPNLNYKEDPSIDRKEKFLKKHAKSKALSDINNTMNSILLDISQSLSNPTSEGYQFYQSSTDISSMLSPEVDISGSGGVKNIKFYLNKYVERSEKYWSLPRSHIPFDELTGKDKLSENQEPIDMLLRDSPQDNLKSSTPTTGIKLDKSSTVKHTTIPVKSPSDNLHFFYLEPYKRQIVNIKDNHDPQKDKDTSPEEKTNIDDILNRAYQDEMNWIRKRHQPGSLKIDKYNSSTSSLGILVKQYEEQARNTSKDEQKKSSSMKTKKGNTDEQLNGSKPLKPLNDTHQNKQKDSPSERHLHDIASGRNIQKPEIQKSATDTPKRHIKSIDNKSKHEQPSGFLEPIDNRIPVPDASKHSEPPNRVSRHSDTKTKSIDRTSIRENKTLSKFDKDHFNDPKSKQENEQEEKHHRHLPPPPPSPIHHLTSKKDDDLKNSEKHVYDVPTSFSKFKKDMNLSDKQKGELSHQNPDPSHEMSTTFSRDSKFRKPIHNIEGPNENLPSDKHQSLLRGKDVDEPKDNEQSKLSKHKIQPNDTTGLHALGNHEQTSKERRSSEKHRVSESSRPSKTHYHSLRIKQKKPYVGGLSTKDERISSWIENSKQQTRQLLEDGEIDKTPELEPHKPNITRHRSLSEKHYPGDRKMTDSGTVEKDKGKSKPIRIDDHSGKRKKKDSKISDNTTTKTPKSDQKTDDQKNSTHHQADSDYKIQDSHKRSTGKQTQDINTKDKTEKTNEQQSSGILHKQHPSQKDKLGIGKIISEIPHNLKSSTSGKKRQRSTEGYKQLESSGKDQLDPKANEQLHQHKDPKSEEKLPRKSKEFSRGGHVKRRTDSLHSPSADREEHHLTPPERESKVSDDRPGHRRHPPPPLSPTYKNDIHYPRDATYGKPQTPDSQTVPAVPERQPLSYPGDDFHLPEDKRQRGRHGDEFGREQGDKRRPAVPYGSAAGGGGGAMHPDEYNYLAEAEKQRPTVDYTSELSDGSSLYGKTSQGSARKQPIKNLDEHRNKDIEPTRPYRHPVVPPQPTDYTRPKPQRDIQKSSRKSDRKSAQKTVPADENLYMNLPGSVPHGARPPHEGSRRSLQELSERSGPHSAYDPRLGDEPTGPHKPQTGHRTSDQPSGYVDYEQYTSEDSEDYDDSGGSDEELKPPALRTIPQTRRRSEPKPTNDDNYPPVQLRRPPRGQKIGQSVTSPHGSLFSPEGMSIPSTPGYENIYGNYDDKTGKYMRGSHRGLSSGMSQERVSRPRSKHTTATSQGPGYYGHTGNNPCSKHSLIISTKRRTFSGLTGTNPSKHRSSSMNTLWFGDHPVPSETTLSPSTPIKLSNIQLQAQAELERRHRSSSHGHSLDRKSIYSGGLTESHVSKGLSEFQGYEGTGYTYDSRGRLIHGGACLNERSASRKRRLLDGHESLSRVWIPQAEHYPTSQHIPDKTASLLTNRDERQAQLDNSAMEFALRDFTAPKIRQKWDTNKLQEGDSHFSIRNKTKGPKKSKRTQSLLNCCMP